MYGKRLEERLCVSTLQTLDAHVSYKKLLKTRTRGHENPASGGPDRWGVAAPIDGRNGFGPGMEQDPITGLWSVVDPNTGANRFALALGMNYALTGNATMKVEYRYDLASKAVFIALPDGTYKKNNSLLGASVVVSF